MSIFFKHNWGRVVNARFDPKKFQKNHLEQTLFKLLWEMTFYTCQGHDLLFLVRVWGSVCYEITVWFIFRLADMCVGYSLVPAFLFTRCNVPMMGPFVKVESLGLHLVIYKIVKFIKLYNWQPIPCLEPKMKEWIDKYWLEWKSKQQNKFNNFVSYSK